MSRKGLITAYSHNTRKQKTDKTIKSEWSDPIPQLLQQQYSFLPMTYHQGGFLFRGMSHGLFSSINKGGFGRFSDANPHSTLEEELNIIFVSNELSDALTCARAWEAPKDFVLLIIPTEVFIQENQNHRAAMMAFAEPGFVFRYPFFNRDLVAQEIAYFVISRATKVKLESDYSDFCLAHQEKFIVIELPDSDQPIRSAYEKCLRKILDDKGIREAEILDCENYPQ